MKTEHLSDGTAELCTQGLCLDYYVCGEVLEETGEPQSG